MHPACSNLHTLFTNSLFRLLNISNPVDMNTYLYCHAASIQALADNRRGAPGSGNPSLNSTAHLFSLVVHHDCLPREQSPTHRHRTSGVHCSDTRSERPSPRSLRRLHRVLI